jgi:Arc/MetJ-type ribon-helix-helix transcriptional regulator
MKNERAEETDSSGIVRRKISLSAYHDHLLNEITEQRYASRSEAVRAATQHHYRYVTKGGTTEIEQLLTAINEMAAQIDEIQSDIDDIETGPVHIVEETIRELGTDGQSEGEDGVEGDIVEALSDESPLNVEEIAGETERDALQVMRAISSLQDENIIRTVSEDPTTYKLQEP